MLMVQLLQRHLQLLEAMLEISKCMESSTLVLSHVLGKKLHLFKQLLELFLHQILHQIPLPTQPQIQLQIQLLTQRPIQRMLKLLLLAAARKSTRHAVAAVPQMSLAAGPTVEVTMLGYQMVLSPLPTPVLRDGAPVLLDGAMEKTLAAHLDPVKATIIMPNVCLALALHVLPRMPTPLTVPSAAVDL